MKTTKLVPPSSSSSSTNFIATRLEQSFRAAMHHILHYSCNVDANRADSLRCRMICGTVPSSVHAWMPPATAAAWSPAAAHSKPLPRQRGRRDRQWSCATTVEHAVTVTMQIADPYATRCRRPTVAHCRDNLVLCRSYNGKLERWDGSWSALGRAASGAHEEEETRARSSLPSTSTRAGRQNLWRTVVGSVDLQANRAATQSTLVKRTRYQYLIIGTCIMYLDMYRNECLPGTPCCFWVLGPKIRGQKMCWIKHSRYCKRPHSYELCCTDYWMPVAKQIILC